MFIDCTAPFRTCLNLAGGVHLRRTRTNELLERLGPDRLADGACEVRWCSADNRRRFQRYTHEGEDDVPSIFMPLALLSGPALAPDVLMPAGVVLGDVHVELHDNTIALAQFRLEGEGTPQLVASGEYSALSHAVAVSIVERASVLIGALVAALLEAQKTLPRRDRIVLAPVDFQVFGDIADLVRADGGVVWNEPPVLWTNRTVVATDEIELIDVGHGAGLRRLPSPIHGHDFRYRLEVGSVFVVADAPSYEGSGYRKVMGWLQMFSAQLDVLRREFPTAPPDVDRAHGEAFIQRLNAIKRYANALTDTYADLSLGVQHERRHLLDAIAECFEIDRLITIARGRVATVIDQVTDLRAAANARARSLFEKAAFALAALTVVDIVINLLWFAKGDYRPETEWPAWPRAPLEVVGKFSSDTAILLTVVCILVLLILRLRARE